MGQYRHLRQGNFLLCVAVLRIARQILLLHHSYFSLLNTSTFPLPVFPQQNAPINFKCLTEGGNKSTEWIITILLPAGKFQLEHFPGSF